MALKIAFPLRNNPGSASTASSVLPSPNAEIPAHNIERIVFYLHVSVFTVGGAGVTFNIEEADPSGLSLGTGPDPDVPAELWHNVAAFTAITAIGKYRLAINPVLGDRLRVNRVHADTGGITYTMHAVATIL